MQDSALPAVFSEGFAHCQHDRVCRRRQYGGFPNDRGQTHFQSLLRRERHGIDEGPRITDSNIDQAEIFRRFDCIIFCKADTGYATSLCGDGDQKLIDFL